MYNKKIRFTKMQGIGNDYVYINAMEENVEHPEKLAKKISDRHFGVGSDGLVLILNSKKADFRMRMFNADGSEAEMCGNASRCVGKYLFDHRYTSKTDLTLETRAGVKELHLHIGKNHLVEQVTVNMGKPKLKASQIPVISDNDTVIDEPILVNGTTQHMTCVSMGNPHAVYYVDNVDALDLDKMGSEYENHPRFPKRINSEFVEVLSPTRLKMRVWERGAGETWACGTGACAVLTASVLNNKCERKSVIELKGGELQIEWDEKSGCVLMTGPAVTVFEGVFED